MGGINNYKVDKVKWIILSLFILVVISCVNFMIIPGKILDYANVFKGNAAYESNTFDDAEVLYRKVLKNEPHLTKILYNLGNAYYKQERYQEAIKAYINALVDDKNDRFSAKIWYNLGNAYYMQGKLNLSASAYKNALLINVGDTESRRNLIFVLSMIDASNSKSNINIQNGKNTRKNSNQDAKSENKSERKFNHQQGKPSENNMAATEIAALFNVIKQNEQSTNKKINKSRSKNYISNSDASDY